MKPDALGNLVLAVMFAAVGIWWISGGTTGPGVGFLLVAAGFCVRFAWHKQRRIN